MTTLPAIVANGLYTRGQLERNLGLSNVTVSAWIEFNGLIALSPGTKEQLFYGQDVIDFVRAHANGIKKPRSMKEKTEFRARVKAGAK